MATEEPRADPASDVLSLYAQVLSATRLASAAHHLGTAMCLPRYLCNATMRRRTNRSLLLAAFLFVALTVLEWSVSGQARVEGAQQRLHQDNPCAAG